MISFLLLGTAEAFAVKKKHHYILYLQCCLTFVFLFDYENKISMTKQIIQKIFSFFSQITSEIFKSVDQKLNWQRNLRNAGHVRIEGILWYNV